MLNEFYNIAMAITMAVAGLLLMRDYTRFIRSVETVKARVTSIQHVFRHADNNSPMTSGYYPVMEYRTPDGGSVSFTCVDASISGRFNVGDSIRLKLFKSRRRFSRDCRTFSLLCLLLGTLVAGMFAGAAMPELGLDALHIISASFVIAICLFVIIRFKREQEASHGVVSFRNDGSEARYFLNEPTAFKHWKKNVTCSYQALRIRISQVFGLVCFMLAGGLGAGSLSFF